MPGNMWATQHGSEDGSIPSVWWHPLGRDPWGDTLCPEQCCQLRWAHSETVNPPTPAWRGTKPPLQGHPSLCICCSALSQGKQQQAGLTLPDRIVSCSLLFHLPPCPVRCHQETLAEGQRPGPAGEVAVSDAGPVPRLCQGCPAGGSVWVAARSPVHAE